VVSELIRSAIQQSNNWDNEYGEHFQRDAKVLAIEVANEPLLLKVLPHIMQQLGSMYFKYMY